jgi:hypothetical protein
MKDTLQNLFTTRSSGSVLSNNLLFGTVLVFITMGAFIIGALLVREPDLQDNVLEVVEETVETTVAE